MSVKETFKEVRALVHAAVEDSGAKEAEVSRDEVLLWTAAVALRELTAVPRYATAAKAARRSLKPLLTRNENSSASTGAKRGRSDEDDAGEAKARADPHQGADAEALMLGQYAQTDVFDKDAERRMKFARLMGGGKAGAAAAKHNTNAMDQQAVLQMNRELEQQYTDAREHHRRKGLGA